MPVYSFSAIIEIIGINPFVFVPEKILQHIFTDAGKNKGAIPIHGSINKQAYKQTLVKYSGYWRLYINTEMLTKSPERIGEKIKVEIAFDPVERTERMHPALKAAFQKNPAAKKVFNTLSPSRQKEILRYINHLKTAEAVEKNIIKVLGFLSGKERFVGRKLG